MAKSKVGSFFKHFFKVIFTVGTLVLGVLMLLMYIAPFVSFESNTVVGSVTIFSFAASISGFSLAFGGDLVGAFEVGGPITDETEVTSLATVEPAPGVMVSFIFLIVALVLALFYLFISWGKKGAAFKKGIGLASALFFVVAAILCFCAMPMSKGVFETVTVEGMESYNLLDYFELGAGAVAAGLFGIFSTITMLVATLLGPKE